MTEVKVVAASAGALVVGVVLALVIGLQENPAVIAGLPPWAQFIVITILPPVAAWLGGFMKSSPTSAASKGFVGTYRRGELSE